MASESSSSVLASSFTDLMTSLAVIFILLLVAITQNTVMASAAKNQKTKKTRESILEELQKQFSKTGVNVKKDPNDPLSLLIVVPEQLMRFTVDGTDLSQNGQQFLDEFIPSLAHVACSQRFRDELNSIVVEGHADSSGKNPEHKDIHNMEVSQGRAMSVVQTSLLILKEKGTESKTAYPCFLNLLSATGRGSSDPILLEDGKEDLDRSRRVVFKIRVRSFEQREVQTSEAALNTLQPPGSHGLSGDSNGNQPSKH
ncbi:MAG TPA: OmpA family protein [Candidatus Binataceae bacterium]|nr:OmpA family protein [Candidatus Binataceae bacterium]